MNRPITRLARSHRRQMLQACLTGAIGLPWLDALCPTECKGQPSPAPPLRFLVMFSANGTVQRDWVPQGSERDFELSPILSPLAAHQKDLVVVKGLHQQGGGGDGHQNGIGGMLTGAELLPGRFAGVGAPPAGWAKGPSVDQRVAELIGTGAAFRSLELGVQVGQADNYGRMCYRGRSQPLPPREDPQAVFDDVFGDSLLSAEERAERSARQMSILDNVEQELDALSALVGADDRRRLELHASYVRDVEQRIQTQFSTAGSCRVPDRPSSAALDNDAFPDIGAAQMDLMALAIACGRTNVASLQWSRSVSQVRFTWLGIPEAHHSLSHLGDDDAAAQDKLTRINQWYAAQLESLITRLEAYPEGDGTVFDRCLILWCNELGTGNTHSRKDAPYVLAGGAGSALETGRLLSFDNAPPHNNLLLSLVQLMGGSDDSFGRPEWCTGPLQGLV
jgi:hypothetical protein